MVSGSSYGGRLGVGYDGPAWHPHQRLRPRTLERPAGHRHRLSANARSASSRARRLLRHPHGGVLRVHRCSPRCSPACCASGTAGQYARSNQRRQTALTDNRVISDPLARRQAPGHPSGTRNRLCHLPSSPFHLDDHLDGELPSWGLRTPRAAGTPPHGTSCRGGRWAAEDFSHRAGGRPPGGSPRRRRGGFRRARIAAPRPRRRRALPERHRQAGDSC